MSLVGRLAGLDRRWIFLALGLVVLVPLLFPPSLPLFVSPETRAFHDALEAVPDGSVVLLSCDYDPSMSPEIAPMTRTVLRHLWDRNCRVVVTVLWNGGPGLVDQILREVNDEPRYRDKRYGVDLVHLGYKAGNEAVLVLMAQGLANAFPYDYRGHAVADLPLMHAVRGYASFPLMVSLSAGYPGTKEWVQQVQGRFHLPMVAGVTAVSAPEYVPYLQNGQLRGLLGGMAGAAEYERLRGERGRATRGMDAQSLAHLFVALCIVLGNVVAWRRTRRREA